MLKPWMIPTLAVRPWRLVRELDGYTDRECVGFMKPMALWRMAGLLSAFPIAIVCGGLCILVQGTIMDAMYPGVRDFAWVETIGNRALTLTLGAAMVAVCTTFAFVPYAFILRWGILRRLNVLACPQCRYSLIGLPIVNDGDEAKELVACPECGVMTNLHSQGWTGEDIIAGTRHERDESIERPSTKKLWLCFGGGFGVLALGWILTGWSGFIMVFFCSSIVVGVYAQSRSSELD